MTTQSETATMTLVTREELTVGESQSLAVEITATGYKVLYLAVPVGSSADALMSGDQFQNSLFQISNRADHGIASARIEQYQRPETRFYRIAFTVAGTAQEQKFKLALRDFCVAQAAGKATLCLYGDPRDEDPLCRLEVFKSAVPPGIVSFVADRYSINAGAASTLSWTMNKDCAYQILHCGQALASDTANSGKMKITQEGEYTLNLLVGGDVVDSLSLWIHAVSTTRFASYSLTSEAQGKADVLALHTHPERGQLHALLQFGPDDTRAQIWGTTNALDGNLTSSWRAERDYRGQIISLPVDAARRPGVIMWDKLWLIGGDCCHPDKAGTRVGCYDFQANHWQTCDDNKAWRWPDGMSERMGHAVLAVPFRKGSRGSSIWVMGGWSQNGGLCNDIWEFDGNGWERVDTVSCTSCLFGATATQDAVWTFGGFLSPGGLNAGDEFRRYGPGSGGMEMTIPEISVLGEDSLYAAGALFDPGAGSNYPSGVCSFDNDKRNRKEGFFALMEENGTLSTKRYFNRLDANGVFLDYDFYHIQSAVFQGVTFLRNLRPQSTYRFSAIHYLLQFPNEV